MRQIREFRSNFPANVTYFNLNSYDSRATFVRMSLGFIFSPDSREVFARLSRYRRATLARHSYECRKNFAL